MKSPVGKQLAMIREELEQGLVAFRCGESGGIYLPAASYWRWLQKQSERLPQLPVASDAPDARMEVSELRLCPESGLPMVKYKVGSGFNFTIDRSPTGGIWFDAGEWEALRARNFHDEIHLIFTAPWQQSIRDAAQVKATREANVTRFGEELLRRIEQLGEELRDHPHRDHALHLLRQ